jgi:hypothetical protein
MGFSWSSSSTAMPSGVSLGEAMVDSSRSFIPRGLYDVG